MKKKMGLWMMLVLCCLLLCACAAKPAEKEASAGIFLIDADASALPGEEGQYALYFRLGDLPYLSPEERKITVNRDETPELALIRALIDGPSATQTELQPVFPQDTQVLATSKQGSLLYVTLNEAFLSGYPAERRDLPAEEKQQQVMLERQLCLDALAATLTEAGFCTKVQVLVHRQQVKNNSLRLEEDYLYQNGSALPLSAISRREETLYTPYNAASYMLGVWMTRDFDALMGCLSVQGRPSEQAMAEAFENSPVLTGAVLSHGSVSANGREAILVCDLSMHHNENELNKKGYPIRLQQEMGVWRITFETLQGMMAEE